MDSDQRSADPNLAADSLMRTFKLRLAALTVPFVVLLIVFLSLLRFDMLDPVIRPVALALGRPTTALVSSKRVSHGERTSGNYIELNYQYSRDYAPRPELKVNYEAYAAIAENTRVAIHYLPGCPSCVALDQDYGYARQKLIIALMTVVFLAVTLYAQFFFRK